MNYLFFDIECANCFEGKGKICSFGYVKIDENFNVLEQKDILINPKSKFHLGKPGTDEGITLAYPKEEFLKAPKFDEMYETIRNLLQDENQVVFGHSVGNDLKFIISDCERYKKEKFYIKTYDTQVIYRQMRDLKNDTGLEKLCDEYKIEKEALHRSDYDAYITMQVLKNICKERNCGINEIIEEFPNSYLEVKNGEIIKQFNPISNAKVLLHYAKKIHMDRSMKIKDMVGVMFAIDDVFEENDMERAKKIVNLIRKKGADYTIRIKKCNIYVEVDKDSPRSQKARAILNDNEGLFKIINLEEMKNMLRIEEEI